LVANHPKKFGAIILNKPKLHLVFGGRVEDPRTLDFNDLENIDIVGIFANYNEAEEAWRSAAHRTVDDAEMKYVVVHLHKLLEPHT
jgi:DMSO/TMAO reductase YedYZ molybdopterin-dependent catalytic subunit